MPGGPAAESTKFLSADSRFSDTMIEFKSDASMVLCNWFIPRTDNIHVIKQGLFPLRQSVTMANYTIVVYCTSAVAAYHGEHTPQTFAQTQPLF